MKRHLATLMAIAAVAAICGCKSVEWPKQKWNPFDKLIGKSTTEFGNPTQIALFWKDAVYDKPGSQSTRGFGARIFFYDKYNEPVKADGELIVYAYDDSKSQSGSAAADRKYVFPQTQFQNHYNETQLGPSYSVWLPWDKVGGIRKTVTLVPIFSTADGQILKSGQTINVLPGKAPDEQQVQTHSPSFQAPLSRHSETVAQAAFVAADSSLSALRDRAPADRHATQIESTGHQTDIVTSTSKVPQTRISTISVPRDLGRRLSKLPPISLPPAELNRVKITGSTLINQPVIGQTSTKPPERSGIQEQSSRPPYSSQTTSPVSFEEARQAALPAIRPVFGQPGSLR